MSSVFAFLHFVAAFGVFELAIGIFGFFSLSLFSVVGQYTLGASTGETFAITFMLVLLPTMLMGATLPLLVVYLVRVYRHVGRSVGVLYFVNTLGSAVACFAAAIWLFGMLGKSGTVLIAAVMNFIVGAVALAMFFGSRAGASTGVASGAPMNTTDSSAAPNGQNGIRFPLALCLVAVIGYISLSYEILWAKIYSFLTGGHPSAFPLMLGAFLAGIAIGSWASRFFCKDPGNPVHLRSLGYFVLLANAIGFFVIPVLSYIMLYTFRWTVTLPLVMLASAMLGATLPLASHFALKPNDRVGAGVSYLYVANIIGSAGGSLITGFVLLDYWSIGKTSVFLAMLGTLLGGALLFPSRPIRLAHALRLGGVVAVAATIMVTAQPLFDQIHERLLFKWEMTPSTRFVQTTQTKTGIINVTNAGIVYGHGSYDGSFNLNLIEDTNEIVRAFFVGAIHPQPEEVLMIGLASGSWAQVIAHHPGVSSLTIVEINPGYRDVVAANPLVASLLNNPKAEIVVDDGRRWLAQHNERHFDVIVMNTTQHWRGHVTNLLSHEFLKLVEARLKPNGIYYFNATTSNEAQRTAVVAFPYALRISSMVAVSNSPIRIDPSRWRQLLTNYVIDGRPTFHLDNPWQRQRFEQTLSLASDFGTRSSTRPDEQPFLEQRADILVRTQGLPVITDDNMLTEWKYRPPGPFPARIGRIKELLIEVFD